MIYFILTYVLSFCFYFLLKFFNTKHSIRQTEREEGLDSHKLKSGTPTLGGIIFVLIPTCLLLIKYQSFDAIIISIAYLSFSIVGFIDDVKIIKSNKNDGLTPKKRLILEYVISFIILILCLIKGYSKKILIMELTINLGVFFLPFMSTFMVGTANSYNLTDGIDGLSTSVTTIILTCLVSIGIILGIKEVTLAGTILIGACLGFLIFNLHPAKVFMGDTGSLALGGAIAGIALYLKMPLLLIIIALVPIIETVSVMMQVAYYKKTGKRIFKMAPIHHHFELCGWKEGKVVSVFSIITLILCIIGISVI